MKTGKFVFFVFAIFSSLLAKNREEPSIALISEGFGHIIGRHLEFLEVDFDTDQLIKGIQDARSGKEPPISEKECIQAIHSAQEKKHGELCKKNLQQAELFLADHAKQEGVIVLEGGKIQYRVLAQGHGPEVHPHSSPLIRYTVKKLDGSTISDASETEQISLDETIAGLKIGLIGMKEGEKRVLYIHPDLCYRAKGGFLFPPNMLLIFEIEILKG